jgi:hypothetical protein
MIISRLEGKVQEKIRSESVSNPIVAATCSALDASREPFEIEPQGTGLEVRACSALPSGIPNRARMKVFSPKPGHTLVFFYKRSLVPFSRDRYSYGGVELKTPRAEEQEIAEWLAFLSSGFHPESRPGRMRRAFPFEIPE